MLSHGLSGPVKPRCLMAGVSVGSGGGSQLDAAGVACATGVVVSSGPDVVLGPQPTNTMNPMHAMLPRTILLVLSAAADRQAVSVVEPSHLLGCGVKRRYGLTIL